MTCESKTRAGDFSVLECQAPAVWVASNGYAVCDECRKKLIAHYGDKHATFVRI